jgi:hypothetical protein
LDKNGTKHGYLKRIKPTPTTPLKAAPIAKPPFLQGIAIDKKNILIARKN